MWFPLGRVLSLGGGKSITGCLTAWSLRERQTGVRLIQLPEEAVDMVLAKGAGVCYSVSCAVTLLFCLCLDRIIECIISYFISG